MKAKRGASKGPRRPTVALVTQALNEAARDAVEVHRKAGVPLAVWRDGKVVLVSAEEVAPTANGRKPRRKKSS